MLFTPNDHPINWYRYDVSGSIELLTTYVEDVETQVNNSISKFKEKRQSIVVDEHLGAEAARVLNVHNGLDDGTWDLESVFEEYFPNLQRGSALMVLFGFFEHELDKVCHSIQVIDKISLSLSEINGKGIERASIYLTKVAGVDLQKSSPTWAEIRNVQKIRNLFTHANGRLRENTQVATYVKNCQYLDGIGEVVIKNGFLQHTLFHFNEYFKVIDHGIRTKYGA